MPQSDESRSKRFQESTAKRPQSQLTIGGGLVASVEVVSGGVGYVVEVRVSSEAITRVARSAVANATGRSTNGGLHAKVKK